MICKFCGREIKTANHSKPEPGGRSCGICTEKCVKKCEIGSKGTANWHKKPCVACGDNPYRKKHRWDGEKWIK